ncbi:AMP-binding protein [Rhodopirellula halodulae]|uniref:AMP-binding protein n=1 Tax=Rhodopirellula halodulae TaxID=2894198 RepID=UPI001E4FA73E|nr:AMP-binding protein [Rhodopirellula sp. JC737]MCC9657149.1 AMP-binding protein [Rhodopirellula sp. JC737]
MTTSDSPHLLAAFLQHVRQRPRDTALLDSRTGEPVWTWGQMANVVHRSAEKICNEVTWHDRDRHLAYSCHNTPHDVTISLACLAVGAVEIPIDAYLPASQQQRLHSQSRAATWEADEDHTLAPLHDQSIADSIEWLQAASDRVDVDAPSLVLWTSGTTSQPRGVVLSQRNLTTNARAKLTAVPQSVTDVRLSLLSIAHAYARTSDMGTWLLSGCRWALGRGRSTLRSLPTGLQPTHINAVPLLIDELLRQKAEQATSLKSLAVVGCGGVAMSEKQFNACQQHGLHVVQGYGCTESSPVICSASPENARPNRVGPLVDGWSAKILDQRLSVKGPGVMLGYLDDPASTREKISSDGWLDTGDLVQVDSDGQYQILGRADDVIVLPTGFKIFPASVERSVQRIDHVDQAVLLQHKEQLFLLVSLSGNSTVRSTLHGKVLSRLQEDLPPKTEVEIKWLERPLSIESGELTAKGTPRRSVIRQRLC